MEGVRSYNKIYINWNKNKITILTWSVTKWNYGDRSVERAEPMGTEGELILMYFLIVINKIHIFFYLCSFPFSTTASPPPQNLLGHGPNTCTILSTSFRERFCSSTLIVESKDFSVTSLRKDINTSLNVVIVVTAVRTLESHIICSGLKSSRDNV
jgi:hypothetical protein